MKHEEAILLLSDLALGELSEDRATALSNHVDDCIVCQRELSLIESVIAELEKSGGKILAGHPSAENLAAYGLGDASIAEYLRQEIADHLRICKTCRQELEVVGRVARAKLPDAGLSRRNTWRNWLVAALILMILALAYPAYRGIFASQVPELVVHSGQLLSLPEPGEAQSGEVPVLAMTGDLSHLPIAVAWDLEIQGDRELLFSLAELPSSGEVWSMRGRVSKLFDQGLQAITLMVPAGGLGAGTFELSVLDPKDGSLLGSYQFRLGVGGKSREGGGASIDTPDGGFLIAGETYSFGLGQSDGWIIKTDAMGIVEWSRSYGGLGWDGFADVIRVEDGYVLTGWAGSAFAHLWLLKISEQGDIIWDRRFGTQRAWDNGRELIQMSDGGFAVIGYTNSYGPGPFAVYLVRTDEQGRRLWQKSYGGENNDVGYAVAEAPDGGLFLVGRTGSFGAGGMDAWLIRTDVQGEIIWDRTYGSEILDYGTDIISASDGGYYLVGSSELDGTGSKASWLRRLDEQGEELWYREYREGDYGNFQCGRLTAAGDIVLIGSRTDQRANETDYWILSVDAAGEVLWNRQYGGQGEDVGRDICQGPDGGFLLSGTTTSWGMGDRDFWIIKTDAEGRWAPGSESREMWDRVLARMGRENASKQQL